MDLSPFERYRSLIDDWDAFAAALARPLPATIWTNTLRTTPDELAAWLEHDGIAATPLAWYPGAFRLPEGVRPGKSLAYVTGQYHVQEEAALIPVALLDPRPGERLLDLCAAPGNKTVQAAVRMDDRGTVIANERSRHRVGVLRRNLERLGVTCAAVTVADAANLPRSAGLYDRVLADVPCSCEGTSRKNPEVLHRLRHRKPRAGGQLAILRKAVQRTRAGGRIVYATCTYAPEENEGVVGALLREAESGALRLLPARVEGLKTVPGLTRWRDERWDDQLEHAIRVWPHHNDTGGFFVAVIEKLGGTAGDLKRSQPRPERAQSYRPGPDKVAQARLWRDERSDAVRAPGSRAPNGIALKGRNLSSGGTSSAPSGRGHGDSAKPGAHAASAPKTRSLRFGFLAHPLPQTALEDSVGLPGLRDAGPGLYDSAPSGPSSSVADLVGAVDPTPYLELLEERFGIPAAVFDDYLVFRPNAKTLSIVRRDLRLPGAPEPRALGMPFFYVKMRHPRLTHAAAVKFGVHATRNVLDLGERSSPRRGAKAKVMDFVFGREIPLDDGDAARLDGPGYVLGRYRGNVIGIGACWQQDGRLVLKGMVSKAWASQLDDPVAERGDP